MRVVLLGGTGYLGSRLAAAMVRKDWEIFIGVRNESNTSRLESLGTSVNLFITDDFDSEFKGMGKIDAVVHAATNYSRNGEAPEAAVEANLLFPLRALHAAEVAKVRLFCNTDTVLRRETSSYSLSKKQFLEWLKLSVKAGRIRALNLQLDHFYGPGEDTDKFVAWVVNECLNSDRIPLTKGTQKRRFLFIEDLVSAYMRALEEAIKSDSSFTELTVASGREIAISDLVRKIHDLTESKASLNFGTIPLRDTEPSHIPADLTPLEALGWKEEFDLDEGLSLVVEHAKSRTAK